MKTNYRGYEIEVKREKCLGGWPMLYVSIFRIDDGYEAESFCTEDETPVREYIKYMKGRVDNELAEDDPWGEKAHEVIRFGDCK